MPEQKLIHTMTMQGKTEMSYIDEDIFNKLMAKGHVRWDGMWLQHPVLWDVFFRQYGEYKNVES